MATVTIPITDEMQARLDILTRETGLSAEELLKRYVGQLLEQPEQEFVDTARRVVEKNAELYRRLG